jgi:hypothetical protein
VDDLVIDAISRDSEDVGVALGVWDPKVWVGDVERDAVTSGDADGVSVGVRLASALKDIFETEAEYDWLHDLERVNSSDDDEDRVIEFVLEWNDDVTE